MLSETVGKLKETEEIKFNLRTEVERLLSVTSSADDTVSEIEVDPGCDNLPLSIQKALFKCLRECFTNTKIHAKATRITCKVVNQGDYCSFHYEDNGIGCAELKKSYGLRGIEQRIDKLSGKVKFETSKGAGFSCDITIPGNV